MNEQAINRVITEYALENGNLRITVATMEEQIKEMQQKIQELEAQNEGEKENVEK